MIIYNPITGTILVEHSCSVYFDPDGDELYHDDCCCANIKEILYLEHLSKPFKCGTCFNVLCTCQLLSCMIMRQLFVNFI